MIFSTWQLQEKCREQNFPLYHCFIDLSKAFDTLNRSTLWKILLKLGCPKKFVGLIRSLHDGIKARVSFSRAPSDKVSVDNRVKQGDISAPMLFIIYFTVVFLVAFYENLDGIYIRYWMSGKVYNIHRLLAHTKVPSSLVRELVYVNDCDIVTHSEGEIQLFMNRFAHAGKIFDFEITLKKTVVMHDPVLELL